MTWKHFAEISAAHSRYSSCPGHPQIRIWKVKSLIADRWSIQFSDILKKHLILHNHSAVNGDCDEERYNNGEGIFRTETFHHKGILQNCLEQLFRLSEFPLTNDTMRMTISARRFILFIYSLMKWHPISSDYVLCFPITFQWCILKRSVTS